MQYVVFENREQLGIGAARFVIERLRTRPSLLLCAATGDSPTLTYSHLVQQAEKEPDLFRSVRVVKLDEWGGIAMDHQATCEVYLQKHLLGPAGIETDRYFAFRSDAADAAAECERMARILKTEGPIDLCILGIGLNGHLALNEPEPVLAPGPHVAALSEQTLSHPMIRNAEQKPTFGFTLGMADILHSREILLLVSGSHKRTVLSRLQERSVTTDFPASMLWLHPGVTVMCDREAWDN